MSHNKIGIVVIASVVIEKGDLGAAVSAINRMVLDGNVLELPDQAFDDLVDLTRNNRNLISEASRSQ